MCVISIIVVVVESLNWIYININKYSRAHTVQKIYFCEGTSSMLKTIFFYIVCRQRENWNKYICEILCCLPMMSWHVSLFLISHDVYLMFLCRKCQINGKYWLHYSYLFHFTLSVPHESNLLISFFFLLRFRIKNSYLCGIIGETRFFYRFFFLALAERQKAAFSVLFWQTHNIWL